MIHVAAAGDIHFAPDAAGTLRPHLEHLGERADLLLLAGDLTRVGTPEEAKALADELADVDIPIVAVLGNHDYHCDQADEVTAILEGIGVHVLEGNVGGGAGERARRSAWPERRASAAASPEPAAPSSANRR